MIYVNVKLKCMQMSAISSSSPNKCISNAPNPSLYDTGVRLRALHMKHYNSTKPKSAMYHIAQSLPLMMCSEFARKRRIALYNQ